LLGSFKNEIGGCLNIIAKKLLHGLKDLGKGNRDGKNYLCRVVGKDAQNTYENKKYCHLILKN
jgi:hypothetical protein